MRYNRNTTGVWIMNCDDDSLRKQDREEAIAIINPDDMLFNSNPIFLINDTPVAKHFALASETNVPIVILLTSDKFKNIQERMEWQAMVPDLPCVCCD